MTPINLLLIILGFYEIRRYSKKHAVLPLHALKNWHNIAITVCEITRIFLHFGIKRFINFDIQFYLDDSIYADCLEHNKFCFHDMDE